MPSLGTSKGEGRGLVARGTAESVCILCSMRFFPLDDFIELYLSPSLIPHLNAQDSTSCKLL